MAYVLNIYVVLPFLKKGDSMILKRLSGTHRRLTRLRVSYSFNHFRVSVLTFFFLNIFFLHTVFSVGLCLTFG